MYRRRKSQQEQRKKNRIQNYKKTISAKINDFVVGKVFFGGENRKKLCKTWKKYKNSIKIVCVVLRWYNRTRFEKKNVKTERT